MLALSDRNSMDPTFALHSNSAGKEREAVRVEVKVWPSRSNVIPASFCMFGQLFTRITICEDLWSRLRRFPSM